MEKYSSNTGGFKSIGEFLVKARSASLGTATDSRLIKATTGHLETGEDSYGGFLVPELWADEILFTALEESIVRSRAIVLKANSDSLKVRKLVDSNRSTNIFGGVTFKWLPETVQKSSSSYMSTPSLGLLELTPHKLVGACYASNELMSDYDNFGNFMKIAFGRALAFLEDYEFIWGTGAGRPLGIVNSGALISVLRTTVSTINWIDIANMAKRLLPDSWKRAVWLINADALDEYFEFTASAANQAGVVDLSTANIFGRPVIVTEKAASIGETGDIILADFGQYVIADREMFIEASQHVNASSVGFLTDETFWRIVLRVDGQPLLSTAITPKKGANTLSPFVALSANTS